ELERYRTIIETTDDGVFMTDADNRIALVNDAYCDLTGYEREELIGEDASILLGDTVDEAIERHEQAARSEDPGTWSMEFELQTADGEGVPVEARLAPFEQEDGRYGRLGIDRDVTERKERERELERYRTIIETTDDGVFMVDPDDRFVLVNDAYCELAGYGREELLGEHVSIVLSEEVREEVGELTDAILSGERSSWTLGFDLQTADGSLVETEAQVSLYEDEDGRYGRLGINRDVTERNERERQLERQREQLRALDNLNGVVRKINEAVIEQSTREEIERTVCEWLADSDSYEFAWVGVVDD
ncbi:MAG: PAS domain-containing protein, partial [Salinigranum sp.]